MPQESKTLKVVNIVIDKLPSGYQARVSGHPVFTSTGQSTATAIGNLILEHGKHLGISLSS